MEIQPLDALGPELPTVTRLVLASREAGLTIQRSTKLIAVQHMVRTNLTLFRALFALGLEPRNTFVMGKGYSTAPFCLTALARAGANVTEDLERPPSGHYEEARQKALLAFWRDIDGSSMLKAGEQIIVVDVGGRLLSLVEQECANSRAQVDVVGLEQTSSGIRRLEGQNRAFPIVNVAEAAAKALHESPLVAETIVERLERRGLEGWPHLRAGVVGIGEIGRSMVTKLSERGFEVMGTNATETVDPDLAVKLAPFSELLRSAEIVFGCTGSDIFATTHLPAELGRGLILASCSSEDIEFRTLLRQAGVGGGGWPAPDITVGPARILSGGYPINFDTSGISIPEDAAQTTTALMLAGILTAASLLRDGSSERGLVQLPSSLQVAVLDHWWATAGAAGPLQKDARVTFDYLHARSSGRVLPRQTVFSRIAALTKVKSV